MLKYMACSAGLSIAKMIGRMMIVSETIDIRESDIMALNPALMSILLLDRTTGKNIIWATDDYKSLGDGYAATDEITIPAITGEHENLIQPRIAKALESQNSRTRDMAEVFTPSWICNAQNNLVDAEWFGRESVFNVAKDTTWETIKDLIAFPEKKTRDWKHYVDARRMEISCGEAPYLVSRYDSATGQSIPLHDRIGLLDRKMRVINENAADEEEWMNWTLRAYQSTYGYEFQGDSLLLARENLFCTFLENCRAKWQHDPSMVQMRRIATVLSWNLWQMDGLTYTIPYHTQEDEEPKQIGLFEMVSEKPDPVVCQIKDWRSKLIFKFVSMTKGAKR